MKILLTAINAKYIHSNLAVYSLKAYASEVNPQVEIAEYTINHTREQILAGIYQRKPDVICLSCYIWNWEYVMDLLDEIPKVMPQVPIWLGGPEVSFNGVELLSKYPQVTGVMRGEGEMVFRNLCLYYQGDLTLDKIRGITFRQGEKIVENPLEEPMDLDTLPFCYGDLDSFTHKIIYYEASRGCPFSCSYCLSSIDRKLRFKSLDKVKRELKRFIDAGIPQVKFVDRTFNSNPSFCMEVWRFLKETDNGITNFHFEIGADLLTEEELILLNSLRPALVQLEIGVQSTNSQTIEAINRVMDFQKVAANVRAVKAGANINQHLDLIAGLPFEGYQSFARSFDQVYELQPEQLQLGFLKVLKGAKIGTQQGEFEIKATDRPPYEVLSTRDLSFQEILELKQVEEMLEVYYNSGQFSTTISLLWHRSKSGFAIYEGLGNYYRRHQLFERKFTRIQRSEILRQYLIEETGLDKKLLEQALLFDLYHREKMKSRPEWAAPGTSLASYKRKIPKGANWHVEPFSFDFTQSPPVQGRTLIYFDYDHRSLLNNEAKVGILDEEENS